MPKMPSRRQALLAATGTALGRSARAQDEPRFPSRPVRIFVPLGAGTLTDIIARLLAEQMGRVLGQPVIVENRPGANGVVSVTVLKQQHPDGHAVLLGGVSMFSFNPHLYRNLPYDPATDFTYIAPVVNTAFMLVASRQSGIASLAHFLERARARPGELRYGSVGIGNSTHLAMEMIADAADIRLAHVPYNASSPVTALLRGEVDCMVVPFGSVIGHVQSGALLPLAVLLEHRAPEMPTVPTLREAGIDAPTMPGWYALVGPAGIPPAAQAELNAAVRQALADPVVRERLAQLYLEPMSGTPTTIRQIYESNSATWGAFIRRRGLLLN